MSKYNIEKDVKRLKDLGLLEGEVIDIDLFLNKDEYLKLKQFLDKYSHIKEEYIISTILYEFIQKHK